MLSFWNFARRQQQVCPLGGWYFLLLKMHVCLQSPLDTFFWGYSLASSFCVGLSWWQQQPQKLWCHDEWISGCIFRWLALTGNKLVLCLCLLQTKWRFCCTSWPKKAQRRKDRKTTKRKHILVFVELLTRTWEELWF